MSEAPTTPMQALLALLTPGPRNSRDVIAAMADAGYTAKQVRIAWERLRVSAKRCGSGTRMHSVWALPPEPDKQEAIRALPGADEPMLTIAKVRAAVSVETTLETNPHPTGLIAGADLTVGEWNRVYGRTQQFAGRGMDAVAGQELAIRLVVERDRASSRAGSCIECQCLVRREVRTESEPRGWTCAPSAQQHTPGPRNPSQIWMCWCARRA